MPLENGSSRTAIGKNIETEKAAGKSQKQAVAIALHHADDGFLPGEKKPAQTLRFYAPVKLSENMHQTKEGFLICRDVPIARTGEMLYRGGEIENVRPGKDGIVRITRDADELFKPESMASFEGKPLCDDHPFDDVTPDNWRSLSKGHMQNIRRGEGALSEFMLADILVMDKAAISGILSGKREVSLGYDADYEEIEPGIGVQKNILGNHIAYVRKGRCGPRCAIRDRRPSMKLSIKDALMQAFKAKDASEVEEIANQVGEKEGAEGATHVHVHMNGGKPDVKEGETKDEGAAGGEAKSVEDRLAAIEAAIAKLTEAKTGGESTTTDEGAAGASEGEKELVEEEKTDEGKEKTGDKTHDAATVATSYSEFLARAEILAPGVKMPRLTKDAIADAQKTRDGLCICKRRALDAAMKVDASSAIVKKFLNTRDGMTVNSMPCDRVDAVFIGASELMRNENNARALFAGRKESTKDNASVVDPFARGGMDRINAAFWADKK